MAPRLPFIAVDSLMRDLGRGIGLAAREVVDKSANPIGTLAVKTADLNVSFEMSSEGVQRSDGLKIGGPLLGAKTLRIVSDESTERILNTATIRLHIVSVQPTEIEADDDGKKRDDRPAPDFSNLTRQQIRDLAATLARAIDNLDIPERRAAEMRDELQRIIDHISRGDLEAARQGLVAFASKYADVLS